MITKKTKVSMVEQLVIIYETSDGKEFNSENAAKSHEKELLFTKVNKLSKRVSEHFIWHKNDISPEDIKIAYDLNFLPSVDSNGYIVIYERTGYNYDGYEEYGYRDSSIGELKKYLKNELEDAKKSVTYYMKLCDEYGVTT